MLIFVMARGSGLPINTERAKVVKAYITKEATLTNPFTFDTLQSIFHQRIDPLSEHRTGHNTRDSIQDAA